jgi:hypothetical protein
MKFFAIISIIVAAAIGVGAVAPDADSACRCPNNCSHKFGDSCKFKDNGNTIQGGKHFLKHYIGDAERLISFSYSLHQWEWRIDLCHLNSS